jgi:fructose 1,6-bisphosphatase
VVDRPSKLTVVPEVDKSPPQALNMSLRDYFAGQIATAYITRGTSLGDHVPELAYKMADKLLLEREKAK